MCIAVALPLAVPAEENRLAGIFPEWIKTVALVAPASPGTSREKVDAAISLLKKAGVKVKVMPNAREINHRTLCTRRRIQNFSGNDFIDYLVGDYRY